jgi:hypothetical protein
MGELFSKSSGHSGNKAQLVETSMKKRVNPVEAWRHSVFFPISDSVAAKESANLMTIDEQHTPNM